MENEILSEIKEFLNSQDFTDAMFNLKCKLDFTDYGILDGNTISIQFSDEGQWLPKVTNAMNVYEILFEVDSCNIDELTEWIEDVIQEKLNNIKEHGMELISEANKKLEADGHRLRINEELNYDFSGYAFQLTDNGEDINDIIELGDYSSDKSEITVDELLMNVDYIMDLILQDEEEANEEEDDED